MKNNQILFLTALKSEAIPIIKKYKLDSVPNFEKLKIYQKDNIYLLIIGIGKRNTINSIQKYIKESNNIKNMICINIGTAGGNSSISKIGKPILPTAFAFKPESRASCSIIEQTVVFPLVPVTAITFVFNRLF